MCHLPLEMDNYSFVKRRLKSYSKTAKKVINVFLCITQLGFCCVYFVFVAHSLKRVCDTGHHHHGGLDYHLYMLMTLPFVLVLASIRDLKMMSPISMAANLLQGLGMISIFFYLLQVRIYPNYTVHSA